MRLNKILRMGLLLLCLSPVALVGAATVSISCGAVGVELEVCREGAEAWSDKTGHEIRIISTPNSTTDRLALYQQLLAAGSADIDVFQIDVVWPGILQEHFIDLKQHIEPERLRAQFENVVDANRVDGRLVALPWFVDAGLLYYRKDLLDKHGFEVPETWEALTHTAEAIQKAERAAGNRNLWGFVWQGRAYEGLTCNALEWVHSSGGGNIVNDQGEVIINNPAAVEAIDRAAAWIGTITPLGVLNYEEEQSRGVFQSGRALFMRNWPYAWSLVNGGDSPVRGKVGITALPRGKEGVHTGTLGGWQLAVSRYSEVREEAIDLVRYLSSRDEQKRRAIRAGYNPTWPDLYDDPEVRAAHSIAPTLRKALAGAVVRPSDVTGRSYNQVSNTFWSAVHATLAGKGDAAGNLAFLERRLKRLRRHRGW
ncbi:ABC transporter substrate-binding protein [Thiohalomonas denitrificans]|uniref:Trehalose/maltose transport system substrate-binding protein n=1 Tax=Thiohalomonas denitrificans TaxID=415747 RepID=A0A1G5QFV8_9GAMM|nr:ABC transporter substrate-binding protein [Thiohalomonas denitrificans]SCZ60241.1 trehalose/maltose transport system substrate-binding protein [Thiohalomonas denitrificans]